MHSVEAAEPTGTYPFSFLLVPLMQFPKSIEEAHAAEFYQFLEKTQGIIRSPKLFELLCSFARILEFPWVAYHRQSGGEILKMVRCNPPVVSYPDEWQDHYAKMGYDRIDPIIKKSRKQADAFRWSEAHNDMSKTELERRFFEEAAAFGLRSGVSVPLHGPGGSFAIMSFARPSSCEPENKMVTYLKFAAVHFHLSVADFAKQRVAGKYPELTPRERECILWVARGKSSWDIGRILGISDNTVNFHIKNITRKLDVSSRTVAALKAASLGIIEL
ncbi:LuxR family transcriptional regulator [Rhizobium leguminosarum bv. trifolii]|uniref:LuxR family transcriptional regulator n=2 Tax=Rhizobium TaxID=379 RepID=A0A3E1AXP8_RHILT|nr:MULTISPECIES: LuxR family transcriptional regulator [Rhizobium]QAS81201.1 LuxR family transcriptional regulator [Rhizobium acidisoli]RFB81687.1 LuxR family transcriptional regulator [Rhizobium leguminosarum bv. trifolii]